MHDAAAASVANNAQGEMPLPSLGTVMGPQVASAHISDSATHRDMAPVSAFGEPPPTPGASSQGRYADLQTRQAGASWNNDPGPSWSPPPGWVPPYGGGTYATADPYRSTQRQGVTDRRLSGAAFSRETGQSSPPPPAVGLASQPDANPPPFPGSRSGTEQG